MTQPVKQPCKCFIEKRKLVTIYLVEMVSLNNCDYDENIYTCNWSFINYWTDNRFFLREKKYFAYGKPKSEITEKYFEQNHNDAFQSEIVL